MELLEKLICIFLSGGILLTAFLARRVSGSWTVPASIYCLFWFGVTFIPLAVLPAVPANPLAIGYVLATCLAFSIGVGMRSWREAWDRNSRKAFVNPGVYDRNVFALALYASSSAAVVFMIIDALMQGFSLSDMLTNLLETSEAYINRRYSGQIVANVFGSLGNVLSYVAAGLGGLVFGSRRSIRDKALCLAAALVPSIFVMLIQGAKGMLFLSIALTAGGLIVRRLHAGNRNLIEKKFLLQGVIYAAILFPIVTLSFLARGLYDESNPTVVFDTLLRYYASYSSGHLYAFSDWFSNYVGGESILTYASEERTNGFYTFMAAFQTLGDDRYVPPGVFDEYFRYGFFVQSNIYTFYRGLITDFGMGGSLLFMLLIGAISHEIYYRLLVEDNPSFAASAYVLFVGSVYSSFGQSLFAWSGPYVMIFLLWAILGIGSRRLIQRGSAASTHERRA